MRSSVRALLILCLVLLPACAKKYQADNQDMKPNLDPELSQDFLKIKRPRPLTEQEKKALASKTDIPFNLDVRETEDVQMFLTYFTQERRDTMQRWLERAAPHLPYIRAVLATYKLPPDIIALPFIESGYNTMAYSPAGAGGMWQFMPATGRRFNLTVDWWVDERRNPYLATVAAAKYLSELNNMFNDWNLALAAYNCGEGKMSRVISQSGQNDFFDIAKNPALLKQETRHYVPKFLAVLKIFKNLEALGFTPVKWDAGQVLEEVTLPGGTDLAALSEACGMNWEEFHKLNPGFRRQVSPPDRESPGYVPVEKKQLALNYLANPSCIANRGIRSYPVAASDTWWNISKRTGVPVAALRQMNPSCGDALTPDQTVYVPLDGSAQDTALADLDEKPGKGSEGQRALVHRYQRGDSLASIAKKYGVNKTELMRANGIKNEKYVSLGTSLTIPGKFVAVGGAACPPPVVAAQQPEQPRSVELKKGQTLQQVAQTYKVDLKALMAANGLKSEKDAKPGRKLVLPVPLAAAPAPAPAQAQAQAKGAPAAHAEQKAAPAQAQASPPKQEAKGKDAAAQHARAQAQAQAKPDPKAPAAVAATSAKGQPAPAKPAEHAEQKKPASGGTQLYSVGSGDTVWSIARKFKVDPHALLAWNNLDKSVQLKPGDKLTIKTQ
ncbi:LysM peptidoglycan-binding domain-containing protein [Fundidesulfovibrio agrisoli]|uniref:LysM peptidoglycan-binding domain-containing protein n=1 Tax=Fundidesulfovibrio agrisoli TaxID=2922717 RepID=UPI001FAD81CE|nr:LysM peptidoglycan-binding domain-containing protein [Fundidesulfovibrio agrisoli]